MRPFFFRRMVKAMKVRIPALLLLVTWCLQSGLMMTRNASAADTGIRGTVTWGPINPGPVHAGQGDEAPFSAAFAVMSSGRVVARFKSDRSGHFEISLPAGDYTIVPEKGTPIPAPQSQFRPVTVPEDGYAHVSLRFDTGMR